MSRRRRELAIRRILVAVDASPHSLSALEAAAELAARFRAELLGLFVEDVNLLRLAELPFAREVCLSSARRRQLDVGGIERQLRVQGRRARRSFTVTAERSEVHGAFRVARGVIASEVLTAASEADVLILGKAGWSVTGPRRLGSTARAILAEVPRLALIVQQGAILGPPVLVVYEGSPSAQRALAAGSALVGEEGGPLTVLIFADGPDEARRLQKQAAEWLRKEGVKARFLLLPESSARRLAQMVRMEECGTLILPAESLWVQDEAVRGLLDETEVPVLLVK